MNPQRPTAGALSVVPSTLAAVLFLAALIALLTDAALAFPNPMWTPMWNLNPTAYQAFQRLGRAAELLLLGVACLSATAASGLLLGRRWGWWIALLLFATNGAGDFVALIRTGDPLRFGSGVLIAAAFIALLCLPAVRRSLS